jgi:hypothetical protein
MLGVRDAELTSRGALPLAREGRAGWETGFRKCRGCVDGAVPSSVTYTLDFKGFG